MAARPSAMASPMVGMSVSETRQPDWWPRKRPGQPAPDNVEQLRVNPKLEKIGKLNGLIRSGITVAAVAASQNAPL